MDPEVRVSDKTVSVRNNPVNRRRGFLLLPSRPAFDFPLIVSGTGLVVFLLDTGLVALAVWLSLP